ncbi:unnamed protein product [Brassica rapa]|uniref:Adenylate cyclase-associated CAP C-terminal domain-containing protein n=2 Tax=Brassica TaxID=3705 RepID=A0A8D9GQF0_BRACM|nr:unnamed protein product [Brassica napus]CAG7885119.1 unnamed protein product [Brassica rapa]
MHQGNLLVLLQKGPPGAPPPPPAPSASLFSSKSSKPSSPSNQKQGMSAVFQQLSTGSVTSGLTNVTDEWNWNNTVSSYISTEYSPTVSANNTTGCQLYLSKDSLETAITTVKSSEINVIVPGASSNGDWVCPIHEHFYFLQFFFIEERNISRVLQNSEVID